MSEYVFNATDFRKFNDPNNVMVQLFEVACSVCGYDEIEWVRNDAPESIGSVSQKLLEEYPNASDEFLDDALNDPIDEWQKFDDHCASLGVPSFLCETCFSQLGNGEIAISDGLITETGPTD